MAWSSVKEFTYKQVNDKTKPPEQTTGQNLGSTIPQTTVWPPAGNSGYGDTSTGEGNGTSGNNGGGGTPPVIQTVTDHYLREEDSDILYTESGIALEVEW